MDRKDLVKKILELSLELKDAEGVQAMMCITDMENAVKDYEKQLRLYNVSQQCEQLVALIKWFRTDGLYYSKTEEEVVEEFLATNCG